MPADPTRRPCGPSPAPAPPPVEGLPDAVEIGAPGHPREAADPHGDRVDRAAAQDGDELVAELLERQALLHHGPVVRGHRQRRRIAEVVGRVQQVHVERVALDLLAACRGGAAGHGPAPRPRRRSRSSNAWTAVIWYAIGQIPQMRATMSMTSSARAAHDDPLEVPRGLEDLEPGLEDLPVADPQEQATPRPRRASRTGRRTRVSAPRRPGCRQPPPIAASFRHVCGLGPGGRHSGRSAELTDDRAERGRPAREAGEQAADLHALSPARA